MPVFLNTLGLSLPLALKEESQMKATNNTRGILCLLHYVKKEFDMAGISYHVVSVILGAVKLLLCLEDYVNYGPSKPEGGR